MKIIWQLLIVSIFLLASESFVKLHKFRKRIRSKQYLTPHEVTSYLTAVSITDSNFHLSFLQETLDQTAQTFSYSLQSRVIGAVLGNLLAAIVLKQMTEFVTRLLNPPPQPKSSSNNNDNNEIKFAPLSNLQKNENSAQSLPPIPTDAWLKLPLCIIIDLVSDSSFLIPGIGETEDVAWAPLSAFIMKNLFASDRVAVAEFIKEILPFTDIIPLATTIWFLENVLVDSPLNKLLGVTSKRMEDRNTNKK